MAARKRPATALDAGDATTTRPQQSPACCKRSHTKVRSTAEYDEEARLGEGGFGCVLLARHRTTRKIVAIKYLNWSDGSAVPPNAAELLREGRFLEACDGKPYVVGFEGLVHDPGSGTFGLVMEDIAVPSLHKFVRNKSGGQPLPESTMHAVMWKLLTGAKTMHDRHVVHRDIKPDNILVGQDDELIKICDFGLAISS